jgi:hypothetical protein
MSWARQRPPALREASFPAIDTLGRAKLMRVQTWAWLIGLTDATDERVLEWARSFSAPPSIQVRGARLDADSFSPERRAIRLIADEPIIHIELTPTTVCVNPVFEIADVDQQQTLKQVRRDNTPLPPQSWAWDGRTLWIDATMRERAELDFEFTPPED